MKKRNMFYLSIIQAGINFEPEIDTQSRLDYNLVLLESQEVTDQYSNVMFKWSKLQVQIFY